MTGRPALDTATLDWMVQHRIPALTEVLTVVTTLGGTLGVGIAAAAVAVFLVARGRRAYAAAIVGATAVSLLAMTVVKEVVRRPRPPLPERLVDLSTFSFPSGHAMVSAAFASAVVATLVTLGTPRKRTRAAAAVVTAASLLIGFSRVYLGAHWLSDVVAGWMLGVVIGIAGVVLAGTVSDRAER